MSAEFSLVYQLATQYFVLSFAALLGILAWTLVKAGQPISALTFLGFGATLLAGEGASIYFTGQTISENWWLMDASNPDAANTSLLILTGLLLIIVVHLGKISISRFTNKDKKDA